MRLLEILDSWPCCILCLWSVSCFFKCYLHSSVSPHCLLLTCSLSWKDKNLPFPRAIANPPPQHPCPSSFGFLDSCSSRAHIFHGIFLSLAVSHGSCIVVHSWRVPLWAAFFPCVCWSYVNAWSWLCSAEVQLMHLNLLLSRAGLPLRTYLTYVFALAALVGSLYINVLTLAASICIWWMHVRSSESLSNGQDFDRS